MRSLEIFLDDFLNAKRELCFLNFYLEEKHIEHQNF
jgi:hypothetical protein